MVLSDYLKPKKVSNIWDMVPFLAVCLFVMSIPIKFRLANNIGLVLFLIYGLFQIKKAGLPKDLFFWNSLAFFSIYIIGLHNTENFHQAFRNIERLLPIIIVPLFFATWPGNLVKWKTNILSIFVFSCFVVTIICLAGTFYTNYSKGLVFAYRNAWYYSAENLVDQWGIHQSYLALYLGFCINILLFFIERSRKYTWIAGFLIVYFFVFQLFLAARLPLFLSVITFSIQLGYILSKRISLVFSVILISCLLSLLFIVMLQTPIIREKFKGVLAINLDRDNKKFSANLRLYKWESTFRIIKKNWVTGVGTGDLRDELVKEYKKDNCENCFINRYNPHNQYLDSFATVGVAGFILFISLLAYLFYTGFKSRNLLFVNFLILFSAFSITESTLLSNKGVIFYAFFSALFYYEIIEKDKALS